MWPYWLMFLLPASAALAERARGYAKPALRRQRWDGFALLAATALALMVGFRQDVGGDWGAYLRQFEDVQGISLWEALSRPDPGYALINWLSAEAGFDIYGVNVFCGAVFAGSLLHFCRTLPRPWLALTVAIPYLVIVVGMGYSRQGAALAFVMLGLVALKNRLPVKFVFWVLVGATFHKTAVLILPIAAFAGSRNRIWRIVLVAVTMSLGYAVLLQDSFDTLYANYVEAEIQSEGAFVRLAMNAVPAAMLLFWRKRFQFSSEDEMALWRWFSIISLALLAGLFFTAASTAIDRMALYMLPLQVVIFSHLPSVLGGRKGRSSAFVSAAIVLYYSLVMFIWMNFANHSGYWLPYRFYPLEAL